MTNQTHLRVDRSVWRTVHALKGSDESVNDFLHRALGVDESTDRLGAATLLANQFGGGVDDTLADVLEAPG